MIVENRRTFIRNSALIAAGLILNTCFGEFPEDPVNIENIKKAEQIFRDSGETKIPIAGLGSDFVPDVTSFGEGRIEVHFKLSKDKVIFPSLAEGNAIVNESENTEVLSRVIITGKNMTWQFQTYGIPKPNQNSSVQIGQPLFKLDFSTFVPRSRTNDFYDDPIMLIKAWKNDDPKEMSTIGKSNLIAVNGKPLEIKARQI